MNLGKGEREGQGGRKEKVRGIERWLRSSSFVNSHVFNIYRNRFHDFLTKQFCQENLQFYEVVMEWKNMRADDTERGVKARAIIDVVCIKLISILQ